MKLAYHLKPLIVLINYFEAFNLNYSHFCAVRIGRKNKMLRALTSVLNQLFKEQLVAEVCVEHYSQICFSLVAYSNITCAGMADIGNK